MGTNYYASEKPRNVCTHCGRSDPVEELHIGKSSGGWCFSLHIMPELGIWTLADWERKLSDMSIRDEYGNCLSLEELLDVITKRSTSWEKSPGFHQQNHSQDGPNGLVRSRIDGRHCVGHGEGTWDYMIGEFS